jgi:hypothetical protein
MRDPKQPTFLKPTDFWEQHRAQLPFKTYSAIKYHLAKRRHNGLLESGAVVESPIGTLINPDRFIGQWLCGKKTPQRDAA